MVVFVGGAFKNDDDGEDTKEGCPPFRLPARLWTDATDSKTPEEKCSQIYQAYITMAATRVVMAQDDGFGNECSEDVVVSETTSKILEHKEGHGMLWHEFCAKHVDESRSDAQESGAANNRDETRVRVV